MVPAAISASAYRTARASGDDVLFDSDERGMLRREPHEQVDVERLDEPHVDHRRVERFAGGERRLQHAAEREDRNSMMTPRRLPPRPPPARSGSAVIAATTGTPGPLPRG